MSKSRTKNQLGDWVSRVKGSSHDVVLAGLASLSRTYRGDEVRGEADFDTLVSEGRRLEPEVREAARKVWRDWVGKADGDKPAQPLTRLQGVFDERVMSVLARLGVPSGEDVADLRAKVDGLLEREARASGSRPKITPAGKPRRPRAVPQRRRAAKRRAVGPVSGRGAARG